MDRPIGPLRHQPQCLVHGRHGDNRTTIRSDLAPSRPAVYGTTDILMPSSAESQLRPPDLSFRTPCIGPRGVAPLPIDRRRSFRSFQGTGSFRRLSATGPVPNKIEILNTSVARLSLRPGTFSRNPRHSIRGSHPIPLHLDSRDRPSRRATVRPTRKNSSAERRQQPVPGEGEELILLGPDIVDQDPVEPESVRLPPRALMIVRPWPSMPSPETSREKKSGGDGYGSRPPKSPSGTPAMRVGGRPILHGVPKQLTGLFALGDSKDRKGT